MGIRKVVLTAVKGGNAVDSIERCYNELSTKIDFCYDVTLQEARDHLVLAFNASQKHVPQLLAIVASHGIGAQPGTRIAIQDLLTIQHQLVSQIVMGLRQITILGFHYPPQLHHPHLE